MKEYSKILIRKYCIDHPDDGKAEVLHDLLWCLEVTKKLPSPEDMAMLKLYIGTEQDKQLMEAMRELYFAVCFQ